MQPLLLAAIVGTLTAIGGLAIDVRLVGKPIDARRGLSLTLLSYGAWLIAIVLAANWLQTPGFAGPVQYWTDGAGRVESLFHVRVTAMFLMFPALLLAITIPFSANGASPAEEQAVGIRRLVLPAMALLTFAVGCSVFFAFRFFPTV